MSVKLQRVALGFLSGISPNKKLTLWIILVMSTLIVGGVQWQSGAKIQTDILAMLPKVSESPLTQRAMAAVEQQLANRLYIGVIAADKNQAVNGFACEGVPGRQSLILENR